MTSKILCPTDGSDHATVGVHLAVEVAKATGGHLTLCVVNIAHGGARGPTINHMTDEEAQQLMASAEALAKADGLTDVGALGIELNFDEALTSRILTPELQHALNGMVSRERSVIGPVTPCGQQLKSMAQRHLTRMDEASGLFAPELIGQSHAMTEVDLMDRPDLRDVDETFAEMARTLLEELAFTNHPSQEVSTGRRREIALQVEAMLWEPPFLHEESFSATLDEFAQIFSVSTRTIQIAIQEQFGMGFVALRRLIRLTQLRRAILDSNGAASLSSLASDYKLHFGRLAQEYSQLFGIKPSQELRQLRKAQASALARLRRAD